MATAVQSCFETLLCSDRSSLSLLQSSSGDTELTIKLTILDLLRSSMSLWDEFLRWLLSVTSLQSRASLAVSETSLAQAMEFSALVHDLVSCVSFLTTSISKNHVNLNPKFSMSWDRLSLELQTRKDVLQNLAQRLLDLVRPNFDFVIANLNQSQSASTKRLTIVASIFLPLSLASSLLAMTTPAAEIGRLWYDWVGLWLAIGFVATAGYLLWKWADLLISQPVNIHRLFIPVILGLFGELGSFLFPWIVLLFAVFLTSYLVGMFDSLQSAPDALKYGSVAFAALIALRLILLFAHVVLNIVRFGCRKWRGRRIVFFTVLYVEFYFCLRCVGGSFEDLANVLVHFCLPFYSLAVGDMPHSGIGDSVERVLRAAVKSRWTKQLIRDERESLRVGMEQANNMQDPALQEVVQKIREMAATDGQIQDLLEGIV